MTYEELAALVPESACESTCSGELVIYTGLRLNPGDENGDLIPFECPECSGEDPADNEHDCEDPWHVENRVHEPSNNETILSDHDLSRRTDADRSVAVGPDSEVQP